LSKLKKSFGFIRQTLGKSNVCDSTLCLCGWFQLAGNGSGIAEGGDF